MAKLELDIQDINKNASENFLGFKATSKSIKPVHLGHVMLTNLLGYSYNYDELLEFTIKPSKKDYEEISDEIKKKFQSDTAIETTQMNHYRSLFHQILHDDMGYYPKSSESTAPTFTSDWLLNDTYNGASVGQYLYTLIKDNELVEDKLRKQLQNHRDGMSVLFRPFLKFAEKESVNPKTIDSSPLGEIFEEDSVSEDLQEGFHNIALHIDGSRQEKNLKQLREFVKFASFAFYCYSINRNNELEEDGKESKVPMLLNYAQNSQVIERASVNTANLGYSEVENGTRKGIRHELDRKGAKSLNREQIMEIVESDKFYAGRKRTGSKHEDAVETFKEMYDSSTEEDDFEKLVDVLNNANHLSLFKTYTPKGTIKSFGWRSGILKPRGNTRNRYYEPDVELLEALIISVIKPDEKIPLVDLLKRLKEKYGILVGGTEEEEIHLEEWNISLGTTQDRVDPLKKNYDGLKRILVDLGYAEEYADDVTMVKGDTS